MEKKFFPESKTTPKIFDVTWDQQNKDIDKELPFSKRYSEIVLEILEGNYDDLFSLIRVDKFYQVSDLLREVQKNNINRYGVGNFLSVLKDDSCDDTNLMEFINEDEFNEDVEGDKEIIQSFFGEVLCDYFNVLIKRNRVKALKDLRYVIDAIDEYQREQYPEVEQSDLDYMNRPINIV
jgi:hypothetical protein